jgi:hypothetical protein
MKHVVFILACLLLLSASVEKKDTLPKSLKEISGWVFANDSTLIAHNDSGNDPKLFVIKKNGKIIHETMIKDVENVDFEACTRDKKGNFYLGDIGNNLNKRKNLVVYKMSIENILTQDEVSAKKIFFSYPEQMDFPPADSLLDYDAEALAFRKDSLYIFTKCRTIPFTGKSMIYAFPAKAGTYKATLKGFIRTGRRDWYRDAVTSAEFFNNTLYLQTYNRLIVYDYSTGKPVFTKQVNMLPITQKEALAVRKKGVIYVADERHKILGGGHIFVVKPDKK